MELSPQIVQEAVLQAKSEALNAGIPLENLDAVASTLATLALLGVRSKEANTIPSTIAVFPETFAEWSQHFDLKTHFDRFIAVAVYLFEQKQIKAVNTSDVAQMYSKARWQKPKNMADVFAKAAERILFAEAEDVTLSDEGLKAWQLTQTGYKYLLSLRKED